MEIHAQMVFPLKEEIADQKKWIASFLDLYNPLDFCKLNPGCLTLLIQYAVSQFCELILWLDTSPGGLRCKTVLRALFWIHLADSSIFIKHT